MYRIGGTMELVGLAKEEGLLISWLPEGLGIELSQQKLESLKRQYEAEMDALRQQLEVQREHSDHVDNQLRSQYTQAMFSLRQALHDSSQQKELDAVVGQLQELHQRQLQQLTAQHQHDTALQVSAMRVTVEQVQTSRLKLLEEEHKTAVQDMKKQHKEQLNTVQAKLSSQDGTSPLSASEELTQQYQKLVQKINQSLEKEVLHHLHGDQNRDGDEKEADSKVNGVSTDTISSQQAEAIQHALQVQQEEVLSLRSKLLQEYETMLQQRSEGMSEQTEEVQQLQDEMVQLQQQYQTQIEHFQARIAQYNKEEEQRRAEQQQHERELEDMKASYEQRLADLENSFSARISALGQNAALMSLEAVGDGGDSGQQADEDSFELDLSSKLAQARDYVHQTATLTAISDDSDTLDSPRTDPALSSSTRPASSKVLELQEALRDKTAHLVELEKCLEEERERVSDLTSQLDMESKKLRSLSQQLEQQLETSQALEKSLAEKDRQLEQAQQEQAESQKLLQELTEKESATQKEKGELEERLKQLEELRAAGDDLAASSPKVEEELQKLKTSLNDSTSALWAADTRERTLQEKLAEAEHRHAEALAELQQELEHEAQMERETLESEFKVQLDIELKRQAAELEKRFREQAGMKISDSAYVSHTVSEADTSCVPDAPHSGEDVQATLTSSQTVVPPSEASPKAVITNPDLTSVHCDGSSQPSQEEELSSSTKSEVIESDKSPGESVPVLCVEETSVQSTPPSSTTVVVTSNAGLSTNTTSSQLVDRQLIEAELRTDFDNRVEELRQEFEAEKAQLVKTHLEKVSELEAHITDAEENYRKLKEDVEEREGAGVETLLKDRYDMELELAKNLMQQEFDDTLQAEKKKFVERHRKLMDDFMSDREAEAEDIKQKHHQELEDLRTTLSSLHDSQITTLQAELEQLHSSAGGDDKENLSTPRENEELNKLQKQLDEMKERLGATETEHAEAMAALKEEHSNRITALKTSHQEQLEAAALDTDVIKSDMEQAHQAEMKSLREQLRQWQAREEVSESPRAKEASKHAWHKPVRSTPGPEAMHDVSEISLPLQLTFQVRNQNLPSQDAGDSTPEARSSLEYEETDEEGSVHSFSSVVGKTRSFAEVLKSSPPHSSSSQDQTKTSSAQEEDKVKQLEAEVDRLTQLLSLHQPPTEDTLTATVTTTTASPPPAPQAAPVSGASAKAGQVDNSNQSWVVMLQQDLDRISAERNAVQQTNNRLLQLLSDSVHTYVEVEDTINRRLHSVVAASSSSSMARPHTPTLQSREGHFDLVTPRGAGLASFSSVGGDRGAIGGARAMSSPHSDRSWRQREADTGSPTLEETSILSNATDEGLDMSQRLTESIFVGPDIDAEGEEIVSDARGRLQNAVTRLLEMIERTTQQLMEAKATQGDLLDNMASRSRDNSDLASRLHDLEEQVRQEVAAKEYLGLELHKAEGLISGYSSEREALEEQLQTLEEQKEVLASELETTRSRLQEFQDATGELEARRQDVERQQSLLQENTGQEVQESAMAGGDATVSEQKALLTEMDTLKQDNRDQTLQLQHRLTTTQRRLQERETAIEEMEKEHQRQVEELRHQVEDLQLQLENTERQLKSNKLFLDEQLAEREQEREEFNKEVEQLQTQLVNKEKQGDTEGRLQREIQDLSEQLQTRIDSQTLMHQQTRELQQTLQERDLSAQDLRVWINTLEKELDQRGDTEDELKGRIHKLERRLTIGATEGLSDNSLSPTITPRPSSPGASPLSPTHPLYLRRDSRISLEDELRKARRNEEELVHEKEALQHTVQEQMLQISALRNQLDEIRHWKGIDLNNTSTSTTTADLRDQLDTERERLEKAEEELNKMKSEHESLEKELEEKTQEVEQLRQQVQESTTTSQRVKELEEDRTTLQNRIAELSDAGPFPPELLDEKNAEIEELRQQLSKTEAECGSLQAQLEAKEELVSDLQDTVHSLQRGESCLDVSLSFNEPLPLNASFTERLQEEERPSSVTSLAQELDQTVGEREARINELSAEVEHLTTQLDQLQEEKAALEDELRQRDEDLSQLQEEKALKQEALVEKDSRMEQTLAQVNSLHTEITSLNSFQAELQKDFDTVQSMLDDKEKEIEALTKELLETRSQTEGSDISDLEAELAAVQRQLKEQRNVIDEKEEELYELNEQLETMETTKKEVQDLKTQLEKEKSSHSEVQQALSEKTEELEKERKRRRELQQEVEEMQLAERAGRGRAHSYPSVNLKPLEEQVRELRAEVFHLENVVKDKQELIRYLEEEKSAEGSLKERDLADLRLQLTAAQEDIVAKVAKVADLEQAVKNKEEELAASETQKQQELDNLQQQISRQVETVQQLESEQQTLKQQVEEHSTEASALRAEVTRLEEELAKNASVATDDVKALQEKLHQAGQRVTELEQQVTGAQGRLQQTSTQLAEREDQIQQLQSEVQSLQQEAREREQHDSENLSQPKTPDSGEDSETDEKLNDVLMRAQRMQTLVKDSLSTSLPVGGQEESSLSRWESEPGLSSVTSPGMAARAQATEGWLRRQQRELAAKNRELAAVRAELETWLRRKDRSAPANEYSASIMTMTLRLQEKDVIITSLKRELKETQDLLSAVTRSNADAPASGSHSLSPQTKQQIAHLRSELHRAKSALKSMQERSGSESESVDVEYDRERMQKMEDELQLFRTSASMSAKDFVKKVQELREELAEEHQRHIREVQERARQDLEVKLTELQARHNHEMEKALQLQQRRTQDALEQQQQELEKLHKTEINQLRVRHQQEIDRLRSEELASLSDASVAQRLHADISATQQMDRRMLGTLTSESDSDAAGRSQISDLPAQLQALLDRLREAGEHILSVSELDLLQRYLIPGNSEADDAWREAREAEKLSLVKTVHALKELLSQADRINAGLEESSADWRSDLIHSLVEVYKQERLGLEAELHTLRLLQHGQENARTIKNLDNRLHEQARLHQSGLDAMLRAERQSLLTEMEDLQSRSSQLRRELQDLRSQNAETLAQQEENAANKTWKLQREVQVLEYKLQQEKVIEEDLRKGLEAERRRVVELSSEISHNKGTLISVQSELQSTQLHLSRTKDALEREQNRFTSVTQKHQTETQQLRDALEEEREKNNHLSEKLESLRRQLNSLESGAGRTEAMRKERDNANTRFIKELQAELQAEREQLHHMTEKAEEERRQRKQLESEMEKEHQVTDTVKQELDKLRHQTKKAVDNEAAKLADLQRVMQQEQEQTKELQILLEDRDTSIHHQAIRIQQLLDQIQHLQTKTVSMQQQIDAERKKGDKLAALLENERQQQQTLQDQELAVAKQLRQDLSQAKTDCAEARHHMELEKSRADNLRLEVDRVQSEMRAMTQHVGATERQLETEHSSTWNKLRAAQRDRDDLQVKVHELEMEMERLQDRLQDLELELDRSRQRELEARHDVERHKLYPSPRSNPTTPRGTSDVQLQSRLNTFCHKLQSVGQRLQTLTLQQRDHNSSAAESGGSDAETGKGTAAVDALMAELQALQKKMVVDSDQVDSGNDMVELMQKLEVHQATINQLKAEKEELRRRLQLLEDEDNMRTPRTPRTPTIRRNHQLDGMTQYVSDVATSDDEFLYERTVWASERLNLQMALDTAEHEIDHLKKELRAFRGRFNSEGFMMEVDRDKMQRLYGKYLRAESFRKALVYQKKYLLLLLGGYQDTEQETLAVIATMGGQPSSTFDLAQRRRHRRLYTIFRSAARTVVAIFRMKYLVRKWRRAVRVGTPVVGGQVNQNYGYVATPSSFTAPNNTDIQPPSASSSTSVHVHTLSRHHSPALANGNIVLTVDAGRRFNTPPTKEVSQTAHKASNTSSASAAARRQLIGELGAGRGTVENQGSGSSGSGSARSQSDTHDDFIQRLENLQSRLSGSGSSHNGESPQQRSSWR